MWPACLLTVGNIRAFITVNGWWGGALRWLEGTPDGGNSSWSALPGSFLALSELSQSKHDLKINAGSMICCGSNTTHCLQTDGRPNPLCFLCCRYEYFKADWVIFLHCLLFNGLLVKWSPLSSPRAETVDSAAQPAPPLSHLHSQPFLREYRHHHINLTGVTTAPYFCVTIPRQIPSEFGRILSPSILPGGRKRKFSLACSFLMLFSSRSRMLVYSLTQWQKSLLEYSGAKETEVFNSRLSLGKIKVKMTEEMVGKCIWRTESQKFWLEGTSRGHLVWIPIWSRTTTSSVLLRLYFRVWSVHLLHTFFFLFFFFPRPISFATAFSKPLNLFACNICPLNSS